MEEKEAPYLFKAALLAGEEFDALAFIAPHGYYRQALGCLRNALEVLTVGASLAVTQNAALFARWRNGEEVPFGNARDWLAASQEGKRLETHWRHRRLSSTQGRLARGSSGCTGGSAGTRTRGPARTIWISGRATARSTSGPPQPHHRRDAGDDGTWHGAAAPGMAGVHHDTRSTGSYR
jgi:hypothetical protein